MASRLAAIAGGLAPGWLGCDLTSDTDLPMGADAPDGSVVFVRAGEGQSRHGACFPFLVPLFGHDAGHLIIEEDPRDRLVGQAVRAILLRVSAALPSRAFRVLPADGATLGAAFSALRDLVDAGVWEQPAVDAEGWRRLVGLAEDHVARVQSGRTAPARVLLALVGQPPGLGQADLARLAALAHAGPAAGLHLLLAGYPSSAADGWPHVTLVRQASAGSWRVVALAGVPAATAGVTLRLDDPPASVFARVSAQLAQAASAQGAMTFASLMPAEMWQDSSADGLRTVVGSADRQAFELALNDQTPHWLVGGRTGSGKTVFLINVLYGLSARYSPDELRLYLLDFKEGVSFTEFTPTAHDPTWIPHTATVGVESDREYGVAVLRHLAQEMSHRASALKRAGVTRIADLRKVQLDVAMPRLVVVVDEFHVLFQGNDQLAAEAAQLLEDLARKGRSYGIHLVLASQTVSGVEALYAKTESIFGQFALRIALPGGGGVLDPLNRDADTLPLSMAIINTAAGASSSNQQITFPDTNPDMVRQWRHRIWQARPPGDQPPAVFAGYAEYHIHDDPAFATLRPGTSRPHALAGRAVDIGMPPAGFRLDTTPGRHIGVLGTTEAGADILHACAVSLARQHAAGSAEFLVLSPLSTTGSAADDTAAIIADSGHRCTVIDLPEYATSLRRLASNIGNRPPPSAPDISRYVVLFAADAASAHLASMFDSATGIPAVDDLRAILRHGPSHGVHVIGWWRSAARFAEDTGAALGRDDVACLIALNIAANDLAAVTGDYLQAWQPHAARALLIDKQDHRRQLFVPFTHSPQHPQRVKP